MPPQSSPLWLSLNETLRMGYKQQHPDKGWIDPIAEWKELDGNAPVTAIHERMRRMLVAAEGIRRMEVREPGMSVAKHPDGERIALVEQYRPTAEQVDPTLLRIEGRTSWETPGGYGQRGKAGTQTALAETGEETSFKPESDLIIPGAQLVADPACEVHGIRWGICRLTAQKSKQEQTADERGDNILHCHFVGHERLAELYAEGLLYDMRTLALLYAQNVLPHQQHPQDIWNSVKSADSLTGRNAGEWDIPPGQHVVHATRVATREHILHAVKLLPNADAPNGYQVLYDDPLAVRFGRSMTIFRRNINDNQQFGFQKRERQIIHHTDECIRQLATQTLEQLGDHVPIGNISMLEPFEDEHPSSGELRTGLVTNPANEVVPIRCFVSEASEKTEREIVWLSEEQISQHIVEGTMPMTALAILQAYAFERYPQTKA